MNKKIRSLPVYQKCKSVSVFAIKKSRHFSRDYRETIGKAMVDSAANVLILLCEANALYGEEKLAMFTKLEVEMQKIDALFQVCFDIRAINIEAHAKAIELIGGAYSDITKLKKYNASRLAVGSEERYGVPQP